MSASTAPARPMVNHPNRSKGPRTGAETPTTAEIRAAREECNLTQSEAAELIHCTMRAWQQWESGERRMHPAFFELFEIKVTRKRLRPPT